MGIGWENGIADISVLDVVADTQKLSCKEARVQGHPGLHLKFREGLQRETVSQKKRRKDTWGEKKREKGRGGGMGEEQGEGGERKGQKRRYAFLPDGV